MELFIEVVIGVIIALVSGRLVTWYVDSGSAELSLPSPDGVAEDDWKDIVKPTSSGKWLGALERLLSLFAFWIEEYVLIGGWLAFKLASKWEIWKHITLVPKKIGDSPLADLKARNAWGTFVMVRFLMGTLANILSGGASAYIAMNVFESVRYLASWSTG